MLDPVNVLACCPPLSGEALTHDQAEQIAPLPKALADPVRLRLMSLADSSPGGEACVCDLNDALNLTQPTRNGPGSYRGADRHAAFDAHPGEGEPGQQPGQPGKFQPLRGPGGRRGCR